MAANIWKLVDMYGRTYYYEDEKRFNKRHMSVKVEKHFRVLWDARQGNPNSWIREVQAYRIVNDDWVAQEIDREAFEKAVAKREIRELQAAMKRRR